MTDTNDVKHQQQFTQVTQSKNNTNKTSMSVTKCYIKETKKIRTVKKMGGRSVRKKGGFGSVRKKKEDRSISGISSG